MPDSRDIDIERTCNCKIDKIIKILDGIAEAYDKELCGHKYLEIEMESEREARVLQSMLEERHPDIRIKFVVGPMN